MLLQDNHLDSLPCSRVPSLVVSLSQNLPANRHNNPQGSAFPPLSTFPLLSTLIPSPFVTTVIFFFLLLICNDVDNQLFFDDVDKQLFFPHPFRLLFDFCLTRFSSPDPVNPQNSRILIHPCALVVSPQANQLHPQVNRLDAHRISHPAIQLANPLRGPPNLGYLFHLMHPHRPILHQVTNTLSHSH